MANQYINSKKAFRRIVDCVCQQCGRAFTRPPSAIQNGGGKFCSNQCTAASRRIPLQESFWAKVEKTSECWLWTAACDVYGYGILCTRFSGKKARYVAHRFSYELHYGQIPEGLLVCHKCDNPPCVRPDHLFLGTAKDNSDDKIAKGRARSRTPKLTAAQVREIISRCAKGESYYTLAKEFNVHDAHIRRIALGQNWKHLSVSG